MISLVVMNDQFWQTLAPCAEEVWDAWKNLQALLPPTAVEPPRPEIITVEDLQIQTSAAESRWLWRCQQGNRPLVGALARAAGRGELECGVRAILPFVALFHYSRFGLSMRARALADAMAHAWNPKHSLVGAAPDASARWRRRTA